ncbi:MAG: hypothetical protein SF052_20510 [Bacteroidia bacterium]|nr:hypothetical protein [Bacteroidia bacterium]
MKVLVKYHLAIYLLLLACIAWGCGGNNKVSAIDDTQSDGQSVPPTKKSNLTHRVLVFCDLSASLQQEEIDQLKKCASVILEKYPANSSIRFYQIGQTSQPTFFKFDKPDIRGKNQDLQCVILRKKAREAIPILVSRIDSILTLNQNDKQHQARLNSCILNSFFQADQIFIQNVADFYNHLILITDMIEQCDNSSVGRLNMRVTAKSEIEGKYVSLEKIASDHYKGNYESLKNVQPTIIRLSRRLEDNQISLQQERFAGLWKAFMLKAGFTPEKLTNWCFRPDCEITGSGCPDK